MRSDVLGCFVVRLVAPGDGAALADGDALADGETLGVATRFACRSARSLPVASGRMNPFGSRSTVFWRE